MVIIHRCHSHKPHKWYFILNHVGLWLALFAGFIGSSDTNILRLPVYKETATNEAFDSQGVIYYLDYEIELDSFAVYYYPNGNPSNFTAHVVIGKDKALLTVNHPYAYRWGEDVYLTGYDTLKGNTGKYCILQIVKQPWKYVLATGILMMIAGAILLFINKPKTRIKKHQTNDKLG